MAPLQAKAVLGGGPHIQIHMNQIHSTKLRFRLRTDHFQGIKLEQQEPGNDMSNNDQLDNTIPVLCTAKIPLNLLNEFFTEAFEASELKAVECTHIAILVDTTDMTKLKSPTRAPVQQNLSYPFLGWELNDLVNFVWQFGRVKHGIINTEFVILDEQTLDDKTVVLVTPSEFHDDVEKAPRLTVRSDFRSSLITLNVKSIGVGGDEPWEEAAEEGGSVIRLYEGETSGRTS